MRAFFLPIQLPASSAWKSDIESVLPAEKHTHSLRGHEKWGSPLFVTSGACHWSVKFYAQTGTHTHELKFRSQPSDPHHSLCRPVCVSRGN